MLELFWVISWIGSPFLVAEKLSLTNQREAFTTKVSFNSGRLESYTQLFTLSSFSRSRTKIISTTFLPRFLKINLGNKRVKSVTENKLSIASSKTNNKIQSKFCSTIQEKEASVSQNLGEKSQVLNSAHLIKVASQKKEFNPDKILLSLKNIFSFPNPLKQILSSKSIPVVVLRRGVNQYEVWVNNHLIAGLPSKEQALLMQKRLASLFKISNLDASKLKPAFVDEVPALILGNQLIFAVEEEVSQKLKRSGDLLAIEWANNLRLALQAQPLTLEKAQAKMYGLTASKKKMSGLASWYGPYFHGRLTANGERFNQNELTVAHKSLPFNTYLQVSNVKTQKSVIVRVNDRGPFIPPRSLDLSLVAARCIGGEVTGIMPYKATIMNKSQSAMTVKNLNLAVKNQKSPRQLAIISEIP